MFKIKYRIQANILICISILLLFTSANYAVRGIGDFYEYQDAVNPKIQPTIKRLLFFVQRELQRDWQKLTSSTPLNDSQSPLKSFRLSIKQTDIDKLNSDLPHSGKNEYVQAYLKISDEPKVRKIKTRYRGDTNLHWLYPQKSLRIKLSKNDIYNFEKKFNLINPAHHRSPMIDFVSYKVCRELGILTPDYFPTRVFLNGQFMGVYSYLSQIDESTLRKSRRMPGSIYAGEGVTHVNWLDQYGVPRLWQDEKFWKKVASRNAEQKNNREDIILFIDSINNCSDEDFFKFINQYINKEKYFKYMAFEVMLGGSHHDYAHNHKIYFDPYMGKFEPFQWDFREWNWIERKDFSYYPLLHRIKLNPILETERDQYLFEIMNNYSADYFISELEKFSDLTKKDLASDGNRDSGININNLQLMGVAIPFSMRDLQREQLALTTKVQNRRKFLKSMLDTAKVDYFFSKKNEDLWQLLFAVDGNSGVMLELDNFFNGKTQIHRDLNFNGKLDREELGLIKNMQILYPGKRPIPKENSTRLGREELINAPLYYSFLIKGDNIKPVVEAGGAKNIITGQNILVTNKTFIIKEEAASIHPWKLLPPQTENIELSGDIELENDLVFDAFTEVVIAPGTTFTMGPGASIFFHGKVEARGTEEQPIRFIKRNNSAPWGVVAVQGKGANNSVFRFVEFDNGSIDHHELIHYTAPFNIHDVEWFEVKNCRIGQNFTGDDSMHIAYAKGIIDSCLFENAKSDALDIDISEVKISNSLFYNSGNDAVDIMTSTLKMTDNIIISSGDKGVSVGEWSTAKLNNNIAVNNLIGIEVKDKSRVEVSEFVIIDARQKAINLYNKNKRYDEGGFLQGTKMLMLGNDTVTADKKSIVDIDDQSIADTPASLWYDTIVGQQYHYLLEQALEKHDR